MSFGRLVEQIKSMRPTDRLGRFLFSFFFLFFFLRIAPKCEETLEGIGPGRRDEVYIYNVVYSSFSHSIIYVG